MLGFWCLFVICLHPSGYERLPRVQGGVWDLKLDFMNVLIIKNVPTEGPGTIEEYLRVEKASYSIIDLSKGESGPDMNGFTHLVVLGGTDGGLRDGPLLAQK